MIWEYSAVFNDKENYCLTRQAARLENPAAFPSYSKIAPVQLSCDASRMHDVREAIVNSHA
jgi:hypothetical protein